MNLTLSHDGAPTLANYLEMCLTHFGIASPATDFIRERIELSEEGEHHQVVASEAVMLNLLSVIHFFAGSGVNRYPGTRLPCYFTIVGCTLYGEGGKDDVYYVRSIGRYRSQYEIIAIAEFECAEGGSTLASYAGAKTEPLPPHKWFFHAITKLNDGGRYFEVFLDDGQGEQSQTFLARATALDLEERARFMLEHKNTPEQLDESF